MPGIRCSLIDMVIRAVWMIVSAALLSLAAPAVGDDFNPKLFGAKGDGVSLDTDAINHAIGAAAAQGGVVAFPPGSYLAGSIHLQSNVTLRLAAGCKIVAAPIGQQCYDAPEPNPAAARYQDDGHSHWHNSLIWGENLHDVTIEGAGQICGDQLSFKRKRHDPLQADKAIALKNCRTVRLRDFTVLHGGHFGILATGVQDIEITGLTIDTDRDGIDLDCCENAVIERCWVNAPNDDGICLKSSWALGKATTTRDVTISGCLLSGYDCGTAVDRTRQRKIVYPQRDRPVGRIKLGTESAGGFANVRIRDCVLRHTRGLAIESVDGGALEHVHVERVSMEHVTDSPIFIFLGSRLRRPNPIGLNSSIHDVTLSDISAGDIDPRFPAIIYGTDHEKVHDVTFKNIKLRFQGGGQRPSSSTQPTPSIDSRYPEPELFPTAPAYGLFACNVDGLTISHLEVTSDAADHRDAIVLEQATDVALREVRADHANDAQVVREQ